MDGIDSRGSFLRLRSRTERDRVRELERPFEALPRIPLVEAGFARAGDDQRVSRLHQEGARAAEENGGFPVDAPGHALRSEKALVAHTHGPERIAPEEEPVSGS